MRSHLTIVKSGLYVGSIPTLDFRNFAVSDCSLSNVRDTMPSRIRSSRRQVLKTDKDNGMIFNGRVDYILVGNRIIILQQSKNGSVNECRFNMADSTLKSMANEILSYLKRKNQKPDQPSKSRKPYKKRLSFQERIASYGWTN